MSCADLFLAFIAILFPPIAGMISPKGCSLNAHDCLVPPFPPTFAFLLHLLTCTQNAVWIKSGICTCDSLINIALCCLGYVPGLLHAWYIIARYPEHDYDYEPIDNERGGERVTYYYVSHSQRGAGGQGQMNYGTAHQHSTGQQQSGAVGASSSGEQHVRSGDNAQPPPYADAVRGDHKVQTND